MRKGKRETENLALAESLLHIMKFICNFIQSSGPQSKVELALVFLPIKEMKLIKFITNHTARVVVKIYTKLN
jgi:hypothetical protein